MMYLSHNTRFYSYKNGNEIIYLRIFSSMYKTSLVLMFLSFCVVYQLKKSKRPRVCYGAILVSKTIYIDNDIENINLDVVFLFSCVSASVTFIYGYNQTAAAYTLFLEMQL